VHPVIAAPTFRSVSPAPKKKKSGCSSIIWWLMIMGTSEAFIPMGVTAGETRGEEKHLRLLLVRALVAAIVPSRPPPLSLGHAHTTYYAY